jgi:hypothetical protein
MYSTTVSAEKPLTKYQLFVKEQQQQLANNTEIDDKNDPIEIIIKGFARMKIS